MFRSVTGLPVLLDSIQDRHRGRTTELLSPRRIRLPAGMREAWSPDTPGNPPGHWCFECYRQWPDAASARLGLLASLPRPSFRKSHCRRIPNADGLNMGRTWWAFFTECASIEGANAERHYVVSFVSGTALSIPDLQMIACARRHLQKFVRRLRRAGG
jgi:hypothetical protein